MYNRSLLETSLFHIEGCFFVSNKFSKDTVWGEADWQSGKERWKLTYYALFEGYQYIHTKISLIPEVIVYIEKDSIVFNEEFIHFQALSIFRYNPYFSQELCCLPSFLSIGFFADANMKRVGNFKILIKAEAVELVSWINDQDSNFKNT